MSLAQYGVSASSGGQNVLIFRHAHRTLQQAFLIYFRCGWTGVSWHGTTKQTWGGVFGRIRIKEQGEMVLLVEEQNSASYEDGVLGL